MIISINLRIHDINKRIKQEICYKTLEKLSDYSLLTQYKQCDSVKNKILKLDNILVKCIDEEIKEKIIGEYLLELIPAGTKGVIRGNMFNTIVKDLIIQLDLDSNKFIVSFEKQCSHIINLIRLN